MAPAEDDQQLNDSAAEEADPTPGTTEADPTPADPQAPKDPAPEPTETVKDPEAQRAQLLQEAAEARQRREQTAAQVRAALLEQLNANIEAAREAHGEGSHQYTAAQARHEREQGRLDSASASYLFAIGRINLEPVRVSGDGTARPKSLQDQVLAHIPTDAGPAWLTANRENLLTATDYLVELADTLQARVADPLLDRELQRGRQDGPMHLLERAEEALRAAIAIREAVYRNAPAAAADTGDDEDDWGDETATETSTFDPEFRVSTPQMSLARVLTRQRKFAAAEAQWDSTRTFCSDQHGTRNPKLLECDFGKALSQKTQADIINREQNNRGEALKVYGVRNQEGEKENGTVLQTLYTCLKRRTKVLDKNDPIIAETWSTIGETQLEIAKIQSFNNNPEGAQRALDAAREAFKAAQAIAANNQPYPQTAALAAGEAETELLQTKHDKIYLPNDPRRGRQAIARARDLLAMVELGTMYDLDREQTLLYAEILGEAGTPESLRQADEMLTDLYGTEDLTAEHGPILRVHFPIALALGKAEWIEKYDEVLLSHEVGLLERLDTRPPLELVPGNIGAILSRSAELTSTSTEQPWRASNGNGRILERIADILLIIAKAKGHRGDHEQEAGAASVTLKIKKALLPEGHQSIADVQVVMASGRRPQSIEKAQKALGNLEKARAIRTAKFGEHHPLTIATLREQADIRSQDLRGPELAKALEQYETVLTSIKANKEARTGLDNSDPAVVEVLLDQGEVQTEIAALRMEANPVDKAIQVQLSEAEVALENARSLNEGDSAITRQAIAGLAKRSALQTRHHEVADYTEPDKADTARVNTPLLWKALAKELGGHEHLPQAQAFAYARALTAPTHEQNLDLALQIINDRREAALEAAEARKGDTLQMFELPPIESPFFREALSIWSAKGDHQAVQIQGRKLMIYYLHQLDLPDDLQAYQRDHFEAFQYKRMMEATSSDPSWVARNAVALEAIADDLMVIAESLQALGEFQGAAEYAQCALITRKLILHEDHLDIAEVHQREGQYQLGRGVTYAEKAEAQFKAAKEIRASVLTEAHPLAIDADRGIARSHLSVATHVKDDKREFHPATKPFDAAIKILNSCQQRRKLACGPADRNHLDIAQAEIEFALAMIDRAEIHIDDGNTQGAEALLQEAYRFLTEALKKYTAHTLPEADPRVIQARSTDARAKALHAKLMRQITLYFDTEQVMLQAAQQAYENIPEDELTPDQVLEYADVLIRQGGTERLDTAERLLAEAHTFLTEGDGAPNEELAAQIADAEAEALWKIGSNEFNRRQQLCDITVLQARVVVGRKQVAGGPTTEERKALRESLKISVTHQRNWCASHRGESPVDRWNADWILQAARRGPLYERSVENPGYPVLVKWADTIEELIEAGERSRDLYDALSVIRGGTLTRPTGGESGYGVNNDPHNPAIARLHLLRAQRSLSTGNFERAEIEFTKGYEVIAANPHLGDQHQLKARLLGETARLSSIREDLETAEKSLREAYAIAMETLSPQHQYTFEITTQLCTVLAQQGKMEAATKLRSGGGLDPLPEPPTDEEPTEPEAADPDQEAGHPPAES